MFKNACVWCEKGGGASSAMNNDNVFVEDSNGSQSPRDDSEELLMSPGGYIAAAVTLFIIGFFGFFCNLAVIILMFREKQLWTPLNVILFNLVCSDFSVSVLGNPLTLTAALAHHWIFGRTMCVMYGFFMSLLGIASITTLTVLSFERYVMISRPFHKGHLNKSGAVGLVLGIWLYSLCLTVPPLVGWGDYVNEAANISCSVNWESKTYNATTYIVFLFAMGLVVPVSVISFSYLNIIRTLRRNTLRMGRVTKAESRVAFMVAVMIVAFLVAWTPYSILALLIAFGDPHLVSPGLAVVPALVAKSSICYNPLIYVGLNTQFRSAWRRLLGVHDNSEESRELGCNNTFGTPSRNFSQSATQDIAPNDDRFRKSNHHKLLTFLSNNRGRSPKISSVVEVTSTQIHQNTTTSASSISKRSTSFRISEEFVPKEKHDNRRRMKTDTKVTLNENDDRGNVEELELKEIDEFVHKPKEGRENFARHSL